MANKPVLYFNGRVRTVDATAPVAAWFTVLDGRFQRVGVGPPPECGRSVDLGGHAVVPGFVDSHVHFFQTGIDALQIDLGDAVDIPDVVDRLQAEAPPGRRGWVYANRFEEDRLAEARALTREDLDAAFPRRPVWINRVDYHSAVVNTAALRRLEIPRGTPGLMAGRDRHPSGVLRGAAYSHAKMRVSRSYTVEIKERAVRAAVDALVPRGITAVHALEGGPLFGDEGVQVLLKHMDRLPIDLTLFLQEKRPVFATRLGFRHMGGCLLVDGSIGSYTAALDTPYEGESARQRGNLYETATSLKAFVREVHEAGAQLAFHAIGPRAIQVVLDAYADALERSPRFDHRHRVEHFELATDAQIARAAELRLTVAMQPTFETLWGGPSGMYASRIGERWRLTNRLRTILDHGIPIAGGSDSNVTPPDPLGAMHSAVHHPNPDERVSAAEALRMMTLDAAAAGFNDHRHGSISPGKEASFAVLDADPVAVPADRIGEIGVRETWSRGRRIYARPAAL